MIGHVVVGERLVQCCSGKSSLVQESIWACPSSFYNVIQAGRSRTECMQTIKWTNGGMQDGFRA